MRMKFCPENGSNKTKQHYTFLVAPIEAVGHFNACIGISQHLAKRGHRVVFATPNSFRGKLIQFGFEEAYFQDEVQDESNEKWGEIVSAMAPAMAMPALQKMEFLNFALYQECLKKAIEQDGKLREIMNTVKPDVVVVDNVVHLPALMDAGVPWVMSTSLNAVGVYTGPQIPPAFSGYPAVGGDPNVWDTYSKREKEVFEDIYSEFATWVSNHGGPKLEYRLAPYWQKFSPFANICMCPEEMAYDSHSPLPKNWQRFDAFMRTEEGAFEVPAKLKNLPGKLVYFSMGSIGASELGLMRKLIGFLSKSPNRFIVSKGPLGDQLELPENMWGENLLPQTLVIPFVDLVITHGGNNTVTETFALGKPLLVLPLFCDQLDNATRVEETGHGISFQPYHVTEDQLLGAVDKLLGDEVLKRRMTAISTRIKASNSQARAADVIENVAKNYKTPPSRGMLAYSNQAFQLSTETC